MSLAVCAKCRQPLTIELPADDSDADSDTDMAAASSSSSARPTPTTVPDDVHLPCACHFHWECLLDSFSYSTCPHCAQSIIAPASSSSAEKILVDLNNEGGLQSGIDILPILQEESYLRAYPEERKCRAFLEFCREGDHRAIAELVKSCGEEEDDEAEDDEEECGAGDDDDEMDQDLPSAQKTAAEILRYQDPVGDMQSGLHAAVANGHREVAWLLLLLASEYPEMEFPALVFQEAAALGVMREGTSGAADIRSLRDAHGRTAEDVAGEAGLVWNGWVGKGRLAMPESGGGAR
ncbi:hypothetical protein LTR08_005804 [Meristemomyces frigidus]|nr:hypothetical protein LTR08_005804 [Meristemomyces frigidus]